MKLFSIIFLGLALVLSGCGKKSVGTQNQATLADLNQMVSDFSLMTAGKPMDTNQIAKFLATQGRSLPVPPAGRKLAINPATHQYEFMDQ